MDFLSNLAKSAQSKPDSDQAPGSAEKPSGTDLFASAKVVAEAAQAQFGNKPDKYDKGKAAGAAAELLDAASKYGKLDETQGIGKYVDQAEDYLRQYNTPASGGQKPTATDAPAPAGEEKPIPAATSTENTSDGAEDYVEKAEGFLSKPSDSGAGDYIKKAEEFLNKPSGGDDGEKSEPPAQSEGGYGDLLKSAGGFLNK